MAFRRAWRLWGSFKDTGVQLCAPFQPSVVGFPNGLNMRLNIIGQLPVTSKDKYLLVLLDYFTMWSGIIPSKPIDALTIADAVVKTWIGRWSAPHQLHSNKGSNFGNTLFPAVCRSLSVDKTLTTSYHQQENGLMERTNQTLTNLLRAFVEEKDDWDSKLPSCLLAYSSIVHTTTKQTPSFLWTGCEIRLPTYMRLLLFITRPTQCPSTSSSGGTERCEKELARVHTQAVRHRQKKYCHKKEFGSSLSLVWLHTSVPTYAVP